MRWGRQGGDGPGARASLSGPLAWRFVTDLERPDDGWERPGPTLAQRRTDVRVGLALAVATVASFELARSAGLALPTSPRLVEQVVWALAVSLPLCVRRVHPLGVLVVVAVVFIALQARSVTEGFMTSVCLFTALYTAGAWAQDRRAANAVRLVVVVSMFAWLVISLTATPWQELLSDDERLGSIDPRVANLLYGVGLNVFYFVGAWRFGDAAWRDARSRAELEQRNEELRREREERARRAVLDERIRIARELHDVVAHHVSTMGVQAGAARRVLDVDPVAARRAIGAVEASSRTAVEEMRRLVGVLREGDGAVEPPPDLGRLGELVGAERPGLEVDARVLGEPHPLPPSASVSAYRVVQEALTNVVRHSGARRASVRLRWLDDALEVEVVDDGRGGDGGGHGGGLGLVGMRERVDLHGGQLDVGPRPEGGWRVRARFPLNGAGTGAAP
jgi:signal transduction histidine kinase